MLDEIEKVVSKLKLSKQKEELGFYYIITIWNFGDYNNLNSK